MAESIDDTPIEESPASWSRLWQVPAFLVGLVMMGLGVYLALPQPEENQFANVLQEVVLYLEAQNLEEAQSVLQARLEPFIKQAATPDQATYYVLWGDLVYLQQQANNWDKYENHQRTLRYYQKARDLGQSLDFTHLQRLAETLVAMKRDTEALEVLDQLKDAPAQRRYAVVRRMIVRRLNAGADIHELAPLMARFEAELHEETDQQIRRQQKMWSVSTQGQGLLDIDEPEQTIEYLQRQMIQFMAEGHDDDLAPLRVLLAKAFHKLAEHDEARRWYRLAQQKLDATDPLNADVLVGLAQIDLAESGDVRAALENFSVAEMEYPTAPAYLDALIGRSDCEARLGAHPEAIEHFGQAVKALVDNPRPPQGKADQLVETVRAHFDLNATRQAYDRALDYLSLLKPLYRKATMPPDRMLEFAQIHQQIAQQRIDAYTPSDPDGTEDTDPQQQPAPLVNPQTAGTNPDTPTPSSGAKRLAMQEAAIHFAKSAQYFFQHAHAVTGYDDDGFGKSLWNSAVNYDKAQLWDKAIEVYTEFIKARPNDPLQLEAINHLGLAYQSNGQYATSVQLLQRLVEEHKNTPEAYKSLVPLARSHGALGQFEEAERVLRYVVTDHPAITPDSSQYEQALIELGKLYHQIQRHEEAIARLTESVDRYGRFPAGPLLRFRLADSYRMSILAMDQTLGQSLPEAQRSSLQTERARRLEQAQVLFTQVVSELEARDPASRTPVEKLYLRNAYFYRADCAYDLGRFEQAIALYDLAAKRWESHPASLVALVQIVNAYCELGKTQEAKVANDRARWQLKRIPDDAFNDPTLPMTRDHWQDWLRWTSELNLFGPQANATGTR